MRAKLDARTLILAGALILGLALVALGCGGSGRGAEAVARSAASSSPATTPANVDPATPVVLIVLDELPTTTLMTKDGTTIDARRYPSIAKFAGTSTWYRDNVAGGDFTAWAVPSILTGNLSNEQILPTTEAQPNNIYTLLGPGRRIHNLEAVTELCPRSLCPDGNQGEAPEETMADEFIKAKFHSFDVRTVNRWIAGLPKGPRSLSVAHIEVPHQPHRFTPEGKSYFGGPLGFTIPKDRNGWTIDDAGVALVQQRHMLQAGFADRIVGQIMRKIRKNGDFKRAMIVLTADHGFSFDPNDLRRDATPTNVAATLNPPLIIKYPGQAKAKVSASSVQSIDIVPTIAQRLGQAIPPTDGIPIGEAPGGRVMTVSKDMMRNIKVSADQIRAGRPSVLASQARRLGSGGLWRLGPRSDLIGRRPGKRTVPAGGVTFDMTSRIARADRSQPIVPALVSGALSGLGTGQTIALSWNGKIVGTTRSFVWSGVERFGVMVPPDLMRKGRNRVDAYLVGPGDQLRLIPKIG